MRNAVVGLVLAGALALALSPVRIAGIDAWKIVLGIAGAFLVVTAGRETNRPGGSGGSGR